MEIFKQGLQIVNLNKKYKLRFYDLLIKVLIEKKKHLELLKHIKERLLVEYDVKIHKQLGQSLWELKEIPQAVKEYKIILKKEPKDFDLALIIAKLYFQNKQFQKSIKYYKYVVHNTWEYEVVLALGRVYRDQLVDLETAQGYFNYCHNLMPDEVQINLEIAINYRKRGDFKTAIVFYSKCY